MLLSIILVSYNTEVLTKLAVESAVRDIQRSSGLLDETEILVVDNASTDASVSMLRRLKREFEIPITVIVSAENLGFAGANNLAIKRSTGKYVFLLNPDTYVQAGCLEKLVFTLEKMSPDEHSAYSANSEDPYDRVGMVAATLLNTDGTIQPQGGDLPSLLSVAGLYLFLSKIPIVGSFIPTTQHSGRSEPDVQYAAHSDEDLIKKGWVACTALLIRRSLIDEIGLLDSEIFMYCEDVEYCMRATAHHWDITQHPTARVTHIQSASAGFQKAILGEATGYQYIWAKHKPAWQFAYLTFILRLGALLRMVGLTVLNADRQRIEPYEMIWQGPTQKHAKK